MGKHLLRSVSTDLAFLVFWSFFMGRLAWGGGHIELIVAMGVMFSQGFAVAVSLVRGVDSYRKSHRKEAR